MDSSEQDAATPLLVVVCNQKGGTAKTTTAVNVSVCLAAMGYRAVLVDIDAQGNATRNVGLPVRPRLGAYDLLCRGASFADTGVPTVYPGLALVPATSLLALADVQANAGGVSHTMLRDAVHQLGGVADFVLVDCPPTLGAMVVNAIAAADQLLVPVCADSFALDGLNQTWDMMHQVNSRLTAVSGVLMVAHDRSDVDDQAIEEQARSRVGPAVFAAAIPADATVFAAVAKDIPVCVLDPDAPAARAYLHVTSELLTRARIDHGATIATPPNTPEQAREMLLRWRRMRVPAAAIPPPPPAPPVIAPPPREPLPQHLRLPLRAAPAAGPDGGGETSPDWHNPHFLLALAGILVLGPALMWLGWLGLGLLRSLWLS